MKILDKTQLKTLKKIKKLGTYNCSNVSDEELDVIKYLRSEKLLIAETKDGIFSGGIGNFSRVELAILSVKISEEGKAYLSGLHEDKIRWYIPLIISVFAAIGAYRSELAHILQKLAQLLK